MKEFYIDFTGYCCIRADNEEEAEAKFWKGLQPPCEDAFDDVYDVEGISERYYYYKKAEE